MMTSGSGNNKHRTAIRWIGDDRVGIVIINWKRRKLDPNQTAGLVADDRAHLEHCLYNFKFFRFCNPVTVVKVRRFIHFSRLQADPMSKLCTATPAVLDNESDQTKLYKLGMAELSCRKQARRCYTNLFMIWPIAALTLRSAVPDIHTILANTNIRLTANSTKTHYTESDCLTLVFFF